MTTESTEPDVIMDHNYGMIQVVLYPSIQGQLRAWLAERGLGLFPIPVAVGDDLPTYGIGEGAAVTAEWICLRCKTAVAMWPFDEIPYCSVCGHYMSRIGGSRP